MILTAAIAALPLYGCGAADTAPANNGEVEEVRADEAATEDRGEDSGEAEAEVTPAYNPGEKDEENEKTDQTRED